MMAHTHLITRRIGRAMGVAAVATAGVAALGVAAPGASAAPRTATASSVAKAASAPAPYNGACGTGYRVVNSAPVGSVGMAYLTWNGTTGMNCVVEIRNVSGAPIHMSLGIASDDIRNNNDVGDFRFYAGPLYEGARHRCINWWGDINGVSFSRSQTNCG